MGKFPATLLLRFSVLYYKRNIKHFFHIDIQLYQHSWKLEKLKLCENTPPCRRRVSTQFLVFPISTRVDITVYQHGKCFIFLKYKSPLQRSFMFCLFHEIFYVNKMGCPPSWIHFCLINSDFSDVTTRVSHIELILCVQTTAPCDPAYDVMCL